MFNAQKTTQPPKTQKKPVAPTNNSAVTILTSGCHFSGKLYCRGASRIGGKIEGQIVSEGLLIIEEEAVITAEIKADEAIVQGRVQGKLHATGRVELASSSHFEGDIATPVLVVREGAQFNGHSTMIKQETAPAVGKAPRIVAVSGKGKEGRSPEVELKPETGGGQKTPEINVPAR